MAESQQKEGISKASVEVGFKSIQVMKDEVLGSGSYGTVCKAICDDLICAAKILHLVAVDQNSRGQFEKECEFLSSIHHPNIVLFLGTSLDPDTNLPVFLMELMDESLSQFLESAREPLPFHTEVNICHDVSLALAFLHSNGIIHRDLSSNNVLMIGDARAKVTDFGMAKLWSININQGSLTKRPGCSVYMPPEADTTYSNKLDCFSFGVLSIQVLTSLFPQPSDPFQMVEVSDPKFPNGIEIRASEAERRKSHLDLISSDHLVLPIALDCIQDKEVNRPSSSELCSRILDIKKSSFYSESSKTNNKFTTEIVLEDIDKLVREMQYFPVSSEGGSVSHRSTSRGDSVEPSDLRSMEGQLSSAEQTAASEEIKRLKEELEKAMEMLKEKDEQLQEMISKAMDTVEKTAVVSGGKGEVASPLEANPNVTQQQETQEDEKSAAHRAEIDHLTRELERASLQLKDKDQLLQANEQRSCELMEEVRVLEKKFTVRDRRANSCVPLSTVTLKWKKEIRSPQPISRSTEAMITSGKVIFVRPSGSKEVQAYNIETDSWSKFPDAPVKDCGLTIIKRNLTIIGGKGDTNQFTNKVMSLISSGGMKKWVEIYPRMEEKRSNIITVHCHTALVVAGGENELGYVQTVEVLDTSNSPNALAWSRVADLPEPLAMASATLCGGHIYLLGGWVEKMTPTHSVYSVSVASLLQSQPADTPWQMTASLPTKGSSCVSMKGRLLAVGGRDIHQPTTAIHIYDPVLQSWEVLSHMAQPRHQCFAGVVDNNLVVMGGWVLTKKQLLSETKTIEIASIL